MTDKYQTNFYSNTKLIPISGWVFLLYIASIIVIEKLSFGSVISKSIALLFVTLFIVFDIFWNKRKISINREIVLVFIWIVTCLISGFKAYDVNLFVIKIITVFQLGLFFIFGYFIVTQNRISLHNVYYIIIVSVLFVVGVGIIRGTSQTSLINDSRITSTTGNANVLALFGSYAFLFTIHLFFDSKKWYWRTLLLINALILAFGVVRTESRKGILIIPIILIIYFILYSISKYKTTNNKFTFFLKTTSAIFFMSIVMIISIWLLMNSDYFRRFERLNYFLKLQSNTTESNFTKIIDVSTYERRKFIKYGFQMWLDNPVLGTGLDNFKANINKYWSISRQAYAHNNYVELLSSIGLLGFIAYYSIYFSLLFKMSRLLKSRSLDDRQLRQINIFITIICSLMILEIAMVSYYSKFIWLLLLVIAGYTDNLISENLGSSHGNNGQFKAEFTRIDDSKTN